MDARDARMQPVGARPLMVLIGLIGLIGSLTVDLPSARAQDATGPPLITLESALEMARSHAPSLRVADGAVEMAEDQRLEALMARLPTLTGRATIAPAGPVRGNPIDSPSNTDLAAIQDIFDELSYQLNISLNGVQPLTTFGKIRLAEDLAEVGLEVAEIRRAKAELELVFNVQRAYLGVQLSVALDDLVREGRQRLADARANLEDRLFEGDPTARTQLRRLTIEEASFTARVTDNRTLSELSRLGLAHLCGLEGGFRVEPLADPDPLSALAPLAEITELAWHNRPDLALLDRAVEAGDLSTRIAWRQLVPNLFFAFGASFNRNPLADDQPSPFAYDPYNSGGIGFFFGLDWRFDPRQIARARQAGAEAERARDQRDEALGGIELEIAQAYYEALGHEDALVAYRDAYDAADAWLRQRTLQFDSGLADYDDLSTPLLAYFGAWAEYRRALFDTQLSRANLALKMGLESLGPGRGLEEAPADTAEAP